MGGAGVALCGVRGREIGGGGDCGVEGDGVRWIERRRGENKMRRRESLCQDTCVPAISGVLVADNYALEWKGKKNQLLLHSAWCRIEVAHEWISIPLPLPMTIPSHKTPRMLVLPSPHSSPIPNSLFRQSQSQSCPTPPPSCPFPYFDTAKRQQSHK